MKKHLILKVFATLLPTLILAQNYGWMTLYKGFGYAFLVLWVFNILLILNAGKNRTLHEIFRVSEIGAFFLPISVIIMTFVLGGKAIGELEGQQAAQAGATLGVAVGGIFAVGIAFIFGLFGGIILHLFANRFEKKADAEEESTEQPRNFLEKHKVITTIILVTILSVVSNLISGNKTNIKEQADKVAKIETAEETEKTGSIEEKPEEHKQETKAEEPEEATPAPVEIIKTVVKEDSIGTPNVTLTIKNTSSKDIDGIKVEIKTFNNFDEPVNALFSNDNTFKGIYQDNLPAGATKPASWALYNFNKTTKAQPTIVSVHFTNGTSWGE